MFDSRYLNQLSHIVKPDLENLVEDIVMIHMKKMCFLKKKCQRSCIR